MMLWRTAILDVFVNLLSVSRTMTQAMAPSDPAALAASLTQWWALAGVDVAVQNSPRSWLAKATPAVEARVIPAPATAVTPVVVELPPVSVEPVITPMPETLNEFLEWLADHERQPEAAFSRQLILPLVEHRPAILVITDMPTQDDMTAGSLLSGLEARLLSGMARAIGVDRDKIAVASLLLARPAGGIIEDSLLHRAITRLNHFLEILAPKAVILLGDRTSRAFEQTDGSDSTLSKYSVNLQGGILSAITLPAPFVLLKHPERKAAAWAQLRHMAKR